MQRWHYGALALLTLAGVVALYKSPTPPASDAPAAATRATDGVPRCQPWVGSDPCEPRRRPRITDMEKMTTVIDDDDRLDLFCLDRPGSKIPDKDAIRAVSAASVAIFTDEPLDPATNYTTLKAPAITLAAAKKVCPDEAFAHQPLGASCSGVLLDDGRVLTVRHCLETPKGSQGLRFVFGFAVPDPASGTGPAPSNLTICKPKSDSTPILSPGTHAAFVELDPNCPALKATTGARIASLRPKTDDAVYAIGFPRGLPAKFSGWGKVTVEGDLFHAKLDIIPGNSGSPVFNAAHEVVGVIEEEGNHEFCSGEHRGAQCLRWDTCIEECGAPLVIQSVTTPVRPAGTAGQGEQP